MIIIPDLDSRNADLSLESLCIPAPMQSAHDAAIQSILSWIWSHLPECWIFCLLRVQHVIHHHVHHFGQVHKTEQLSQTFSISLFILCLNFDQINFYFYCEAQGKGRARGGPRKVTERSFMDGGWWMVVYLSLMLYTKFGCHPPPSILPPEVSWSPGLSYLRVRWGR